MQQKMDIESIKRASLFVFTKECADRYFDDYDFLHKECFKVTLSKCLGIVIILGSLLVKVPQILKIVQSKTVEGISVISVMLDLFAATALSSYSYANGFPFSAWGDGVFISLQTALIAALVIYDNQHTNKVLAFLVGYTSIIISVLTGITTKNVLWSCQALTTPVVVTAKFIQAYANYKNGSTGQLSAITLFLLFFGSVARIFTSIQETGDKTIIIMYCWTTFANAVLVMQLLYYWNSDKKAPKKKLVKKSD